MFKMFILIRDMVDKKMFRIKSFSFFIIQVHLSNQDLRFLLQMNHAEYHLLM